MPSTPRRPISVLQIIPGLDAGGAERTTIDIAAALAGRGDRALVASQGGRLEDELRSAGGELVRLEVGAKNPVAILRNGLALIRLIGREGVDIVHARSRAPAWSALLACRRTGTPVVTTYHGIYNDRMPLKRFYNSVMARGDVVIANSGYTARIIAERHGTPPGRVAVIARGADLDRFRPEAVDPARQQALRQAWELNGPERVVLHLARLTGWKGQRVVIDAAALLSGQADLDTVFVLAGDDQGRSAYRAELEGRIAAANLGSRVRIVGHCDDVPAALSLAAVAVVASTEPEAFGRAALEAQAMGVPVVATAIGAAPEVVRAPPGVDAAQRTGWLVPPGSPGALAEAIGAALALAPAERQALGLRGRTNAGRFSVEAMAAATLAVYEGLIR
jgi:glycosyltransferase involved in cell wall biosynthesis